jgi:mRNA interferase HigB
LGTLHKFVEKRILRVIAKKVLREFWTRHPDSEQPLKAWYKEASEAVWRTPAAIKKYYPSAGILQNNRVVFNIKGNTYRLIVRINYHYEMVWIRFIGSHAAYNKINANEI